MPRVRRHRHRRAELAVHHEDVGVQVVARRIRGGGPHEGGLRPRCQGLQRVQVVPGDEEDLLDHGRVGAGKVVVRVLHDQDAGGATPRLDRGCVMMVRVVPMRAAHVVVRDGEPEVGAAAGTDGCEDVVRIVGQAVTHALGRDVQAVRVEVGSRSLAVLGVRRGAGLVVRGQEVVCQGQGESLARFHAQGWAWNATVEASRGEAVPVPEGDMADGELMRASGGVQRRRERQFGAQRCPREQAQVRQGPESARHVLGIPC
mmetsp:Transcript_86792/g.194106  ORF Transcript_86792/g.194106 Transcript_86792/m.194106 type:complete len:259 (+) Transcript_86792:260-1036(+)